MKIRNWINMGRWQVIWDWPIEVHIKIRALWSHLSWPQNHGKKAILDSWIVGPIIVRKFGRPKEKKDEN